MLASKVPRLILSMIYVTVRHLNRFVVKKELIDEWARTRHLIKPNKSDVNDCRVLKSYDLEHYKLKNEWLDPYPKLTTRTIRKSSNLI